MVPIYRYNGLRDSLPRSIFFGGPKLGERLRSSGDPEGRGRERKEVPLVMPIQVDVFFSHLTDTHSTYTHQLRLPVAVLALALTLTLTLSSLPRTLSSSLITPRVTGPSVTPMTPISPGGSGIAAAHPIVPPQALSPEVVSTGFAT
eukprot:1384800-Amorphochlora_amoeboformis.AAC.1